MSFLDSFRDFVRRLAMPAPGDGDDNRTAPEQPTSRADSKPRAPAGWLEGSVVTRQAALHPGRVGGAIDPWSVVVHTTDMHPDSFEALVRKSQRDAGGGSGWHFLIGRTPTEGVVQSCSIYLNANHAGGGVDPKTRGARPHGWIRHVLDEDSQAKPTAGKPHLYHPNRVAVGIEVHCAGQLVKVAGQYRTVDRATGKPFGAPIPAIDVDVGIGGRCWHRPTPWQVSTLHRLLDDLAVVMSSRATNNAENLRANPNGDVPKWVRDVRALSRVVAKCKQPPVFGHVDLDPTRKTDPGPELVRQLVMRGW